MNNFTRCSFSSNNQEFYALTDHNSFLVYDTFEYSKIDTIRPLSSISDFKVVAMRSYLSVNMYCCLFENGGLYVRYRSDSVVVRQECLFSY